MPSGSNSSGRLVNITVNVYAYNTVLESLEQTQPASDVITTATLSLLLGTSLKITYCESLLRHLQGFSLFSPLLRCTYSCAFCLYPFGSPVF